MTETTTMLDKSSAGRDKLTPAQKRAVFAGAMGNGIEYFDWSIYSALTIIFAPRFFPSDNPTTSVLATLATFALGFAARPLGAVVLGSLADRKGRKVVLTLCIGLTSLGALIIAVVPDYSAIGVAAPLILLLARLIQGFGAGGEASSAATFLVEIAPARRRGFVGSFQQVSTGLGMLSAAAFAAAMTAFLPEEFLDRWGWRAAFLLSALLGFVVLYLRRSVMESDVFSSIERQDEATRRSNRRAAFRANRKRIVQIFLLTIPATIGNYMFLTYMPTFAHATTGVNLTSALLANSVALAWYCMIIPLIGILSDRIGRKRCLLIFTIGFTAASYPIFTIIGDTFISVLFAEIIGVTVLAFYAAVLASAYNELVPPSIRATATAVPFALSVAVFGGTAPYITTALSTSGNSHLVWMYLSAAGVIGLIVTITLPETFRKDIHR